MRRTSPGLSAASPAAESVRILILNWRDVRSPRGGGAERVTHEVATGLVRRSHEVTWLSSSARDLPPKESIDGVRIVRRGNEATTRLFAPRLARRLKPDVVLEEINTLPYLAPVWSRAPVVLYVNQLARDVWWHEAPLPAAMVGWLAEPVYLQAYRGCEAITISRSSRDDLRGLGFRRAVWVAPMAPDAEAAASLVPKRCEGALVTIGRLTPSKRYDHAIAALGDLRPAHPLATLTLIGEGRSEKELATQARELGLGDAVRLVGRVTLNEKLRILDESDVLVGTSVREGWGLTVTEAAARGVPAVVYDIPGFRDAVVHERTGLLVPPRAAELARGVARLLDDRALYERLRAAAHSAVPPPNFDAAVDVFEEVLLGARRNAV
jgi:glycosyltransferase involved in cell wall biosynthesis